METLSNEQLANDHALLQEFKGTKYYGILYKYLELMSDDLAARLINDVSGDFASLRLLQGTLHGLKMAVDLPDSVERWYKTQNSQNGKRA